MANPHPIGNNTRTRLMALAIMALAGTCASAQTTPTAFSYQGSLRGAEGVATGPHDFVFRLMNNVEGGTQVGPELCADNVEVAAGVFTVQLDFGSVFTQAPLYLEVSVRPDQGLDCSDLGSMTSLSPRQPISASPRAIHAATSDNAASIGGQPASNIALLNSGQTFSGPASFINPSNIFAGNGAGLTQLNASSLLFGSIPGARMPLDWAAGGDLTGVYPSPRLVAGTVVRRHLSPELSLVLSQMTLAT
ncbi:MAG: hypothetical protein NTV94_06075, partial [Planctomycetota bacterium]|nr:hypothetical protein [Planctomycetota bacterium]